ncbi:MAG TPA: DUF3871 family protein, partial [Parafilimonas sp.]|nr:DUF3871 family protein [Parafilimonas sp.]
HILSKAEYLKQSINLQLRCWINERILYYERMAFIIEIPSVYDDVDGSRLSLCVGGVKAYNLDNLYNKKRS